MAKITLTKFVSGRRVVTTMQTRPKGDMMTKWRKMTWVLIVWCALVLVWAIAGGSNAASTCTNQLGAAKSGCEAGTGLGVLLILFIGFIGFVFFSIIWFMTGPRDR